MLLVQVAKFEVVICHLNQLMARHGVDRLLKQQLRSHRTSATLNQVWLSLFQTDAALAQHIVQIFNSSLRLLMQLLFLFNRLAHFVHLGLLSASESHDGWLLHLWQKM